LAAARLAAGRRSADVGVGCRAAATPELAPLLNDPTNNAQVMMNRGVPNCKNKVIMAPGSDAASDAAPAAASAGRRRQRRA
jgi:hypothetical protein